MGLIGTIQDLLHARILSGVDGAPSLVTGPDDRHEVDAPRPVNSNRPAVDRADSLIELLREVAEQDESDDLSTCPYWARYEGIPGHDPDASCRFGCVDEPECVTCTPREGWPSQRRRAVCLEAADLLAELRP